MEERRFPSQIESIFMLFDGWLSKKTARRVADRQQRCRVSMKANYKHIHKKLLKNSQRFFARKASDDAMEELEDKFARLVIDDNGGFSLRLGQGPRCFQVDFSKVGSQPPLPSVTFEEEMACRYAPPTRPTHPLFAPTYPKWKLQPSPSIPQPAATPGPSARLRAPNPVTPPPKVATKTIKKWVKEQSECNHYTDRWWVRINAVNDCEDCGDEWDFLYKCPECGIQTCPPCKDGFQPPRLEKGYEADREGVSLKNGGGRRQRRF